MKPLDEPYVLSPHELHQLQSNTVLKPKEKTPRMLMIQAWRQYMSLPEALAVSAWFRNWDHFHHWVKLTAEQDVMDFLANLRLVNPANSTDMAFSVTVKQKEDDDQQTAVQTGSDGDMSDTAPDESKVDESNVDESNTDESNDGHADNTGDEVVNANNVPEKGASRRVGDAFVKRIYWLMFERVIGVKKSRTDKQLKRLGLTRAQPAPFVAPIVPVLPEAKKTKKRKLDETATSEPKAKRLAASKDK